MSAMAAASMVSPASRASSGSPSMLNDNVCNLATRDHTLKSDEKLFIRAVQNLLLFEAGACIVARKTGKKKDIQEQTKEVFEAKCRNVDLDKPEIMNHCMGFEIRPSFKRLIKLSLPYFKFKGMDLSDGAALSNKFNCQRSQFKNHWMPHYNLMSGETLDNDASTIERMVPSVWLHLKIESVKSARNRNKKKEVVQKTYTEPTIDDYEEGSFKSHWMVTFHNFKGHDLIKRTKGGTAASAVELDDIPDFDKVCRTRRDQRKLSRRRLDVLRGNTRAAKVDKQDMKKRKSSSKLAIDKKKLLELGQLRGSMDRANHLKAAAVCAKMGMQDEAKTHLELYHKSLADATPITTTLSADKGINGGEQTPNSSDDESEEADYEKEGNKNESLDLDEEATSTTSNDDDEFRNLLNVTTPGPRNAETPMIPSNMFPV